MKMRLLKLISGWQGDRWSARRLGAQRGGIANSLCQCTDLNNQVPTNLKIGVKMHAACYIILIIAENSNQSLSQCQLHPMNHGFPCNQPLLSMIYRSQPPSTSTLSPSSPSSNAWNRGGGTTHCSLFAVKLWETVGKPLGNHPLKGKWYLQLFSWWLISKHLVVIDDHGRSVIDGDFGGWWHDLAWLRCSQRSIRSIPAAMKTLEPGQKNSKHHCWNVLLKKISWIIFLDTLNCSNSCWLWLCQKHFQYVAALCLRITTFFSGTEVWLALL